MTRSRVRAAAVVAAVLVAGAGSAAVAGGGGDGAVRTKLSGYAEVPTLSTDGAGSFRARVSTSSEEVKYRLSFRDTTGTVTQAHIHLGRTAVNGGIIAFLCSNLPDPPAGTPACPAEGEVTGTITPAGIIGPSGQGIAAGEFDELVAAIRAGAAYVNVHTTMFPGGEIRGQLRGHSHH